METGGRRALPAQPPALFAVDWAEELRQRYEAAAGRMLDPWWDAVSMLT